MRKVTHLILRLSKSRYRIVNGIEVLMMQMSGTIQGMRFTYYGYYYSNSNGTIQLLTYTGENLSSSMSTLMIWKNF